MDSPSDNMPSAYSLPFSASSLAIARGWLLFGVSALAIAGLLAILLVVSRTPGLQSLIPVEDFFQKALVVHVNLSVLVWMLCFFAVLWHIIRDCTFHLLHAVLLALSIIGIGLLVASAVMPESIALMNNYVPVLMHRFFFWGLLLFIVTIVSDIFLSLSPAFTRKEAVIDFPSITAPNSGQSAIYTGIHIAAITILIAVACFVLAYIHLNDGNLREHLSAEEFYEFLFWGGGHILQFTYTLMMLVAWLWLAGSLGLERLIQPHTVGALFALTLLFVLPAPLVYFATEIYDQTHLDLFTQQMRYAGGIAALIIGVNIVYRYFEQRAYVTIRPEKAALVWSLLLFGIGGVIGFLISGSDVKIPAHYHGSIVGVTLAFMGLTFLLLPKLGYSPVTGSMAYWQPSIYGFGQLLHIIGLAWSGGYGVLRKTPGAMETMEAQISMSLMGFGGLLSIIGGLLFVIIVFKAVLTKTSEE